MIRTDMMTSAVIGCLVAVACFAAVDSRALSSLEISANQQNLAQAAQQVSFQSQSDEVKHDKASKELSGVYYSEYPWHYGSYPYGYPQYPYPYQHPHVAAPSPVVVHPALHPAVHPAHATIHYPYPYNYPYPYHYPYGYNYWNYNCGYPGCETHVEPKENKPAEESKEENEDKEDKKSNIDQ
ncbi:hypothetical protein AWC38_SpisGene1856 [Stylophora pistillata]|uniref:Uncharacterized protein n=1 Tax=Stylophora pistillata TaxID=50429 RepID=A0A2B4SX76_STYPI|nr:hypothetical protein AWC38_SpisGene1856 [Stylophora pistillata]